MPRTTYIPSLRPTSLVGRVLDRLSPAVTVAIVAFCAFALSWFLYTRFGIMFATLAFGGVVAAALLAHISLKDLSFALMLWMFVMSGFRTVGMVRMPGLPDFSWDRLLLVWIVMLFALRLLLGMQRLKRPILADGILLVYIVYVLVQLQIKESIHVHEWVVSCLSPFFAYLYGRHVVKQQREIRNLMYFLLGMSIYYYITAIAEYRDWDFLVWPKQILDKHTGALWMKGRSRGPVMHPPLFGQLQSMLLIVQFYFLIRTRNVIVKIALFVSVLLGFAGLFFAYTRGPWIATAAALATLFVLRPGYRRVLGALGVLLLIGATVGTLQLSDDEFLEERVGDVHTIENRLGFLANALRMVQDNLVFGVGYFRFNDYIHLYNQGTYIPFYGFVKKSLGANTPIHDIYLGRLAEEGLIAILLLGVFGYLILRAFRRQWRSRPADPYWNRDILTMLAAMGVSYLVGGLVIDYRYFDLINVIFFFFAGMVYGYVPQAYEDGREVAHTTPVPVGASPERTGLLPVPGGGPSRNQAT